MYDEDGGEQQFVQELQELRQKNVELEALCKKNDTASENRSRDSAPSCIQPEGDMRHPGLGTEVR